VKFFGSRRANTFSEIQPVVDSSVPTTQRHVRVSGDASQIHCVCPISLEHLRDANCHPKWTSLDNLVLACRQHLSVPKVMQHIDTYVALQVLHASPPTGDECSSVWRRPTSRAKNEIILHTSTFTIFIVGLPSLMWHAYVALSWLRDDTDDPDVSVIWWNPRTDCAISRETPRYLIF